MLCGRVPILFILVPFRLFSRALFCHFLLHSPVALNLKGLSALFAAQLAHFDALMLLKDALSGVTTCDRANQSVKGQAGILLKRLGSSSS